MDANLKSSRTVKNLMRAFAGESQARNRYTFAAETAKQEGLPVIERVFQYTADQEKEHAEVFYNFLKELTGETIQIDGGYPVDLHGKTAELLRAAEHNEFEEHDPVYREFGDIALAEGFDRIGQVFHMIAEVEKTHGDRFGLFAELLERSALFASEEDTNWVCLNCGYIYEGKIAPKYCPVCEHEQGYFVRMDLAPYTNFYKNIH